MLNNPAAAKMGRAAEYETNANVNGSIVRTPLLYGMSILINRNKSSVSFGFLVQINYDDIHAYNRRKKDCRDPFQ